MGQLSERGQPFLGKRIGFSAAYPAVESATVRFIESDFGSDLPPNGWNLVGNGPRVTCRNSRCNRGGYDFEMMLGFMVDVGEELKDFDMSCNGAVLGIRRTVRSAWRVEVVFEDGDAPIWLRRRRLGESTGRENGAKNDLRDLLKQEREFGS